MMEYLQAKPPCLNVLEERERATRKTESTMEATPSQTRKSNLKTPTTDSAMKAGGEKIVKEIKTAEKLLKDIKRGSPLEPTNLNRKTGDSEAMDIDNVGSGSHFSRQSEFTEPHP